MLSCVDKKYDSLDMYTSCGSYYTTSDLYFSETSVLKFRFRIIHFVDSLNEVYINYDSIISGINSFYKQADIQFKLYDTIKIVDSDKKRDMPSFIKYHMKEYKNDCYITMYIYGDNQDNYPEDLKNISGSAGGIGSNFFAVKQKFCYSITLFHEIGHLFSLMHTNTYDKTETGYTIYSGDKVCDSRKVEDYSSISDSDCNYIGEEDLLPNEEKEIVCNFMSYNYFHCRGCITNGQIRRARFYIHESPEIKMAIYEGLNKDFSNVRKGVGCN